MGLIKLNDIIPSYRNDEIEQLFKRLRDYEKMLGYEHICIIWNVI